MRFQPIPGPAPASRRHAVTVIGSGRQDHPESGSLGRALAERGVDLVTGGGQGVMAGVARGFVETSGREGRAIGILPADPDQPGAAPPGYPNPWVEITIRTHLPGRGPDGSGAGSRNHLVVLSGRVLIALPGGPGTRSELDLADLYRRPVLLLGWSEGEPGRSSSTSAGPVYDRRRFDGTDSLLPELDRILAVS